MGGFWELYFARENLAGSDFVEINRVFTTLYGIITGSPWGRCPLSFRERGILVTIEICLYSRDGFDSNH